MPLGQTLFWEFQGPFHTMRQPQFRMGLGPIFKHHLKRHFLVWIVRLGIYDILSARQR